MPYIGEIRPAAWGDVPEGWALCDGKLLAVRDHPALFNVIRNRYGGDGQNQFALPDLRGRVPMHSGAGYELAETGGTETVTLTVQQLPVHGHALKASTEDAMDDDPYDKTLGASSTKLYILDSARTPLAPGSLGSVGGMHPHENRQPYLAVPYIIALQGDAPTEA